MTNLTPGVRNVMQCDGLPTGACHNHGAGHELLTLQARVIAATPSKWRDGIVQQVTADGWVAISLVDDTASTAWVWNHTNRVETLPVGTPVAVHSVYHALAIGREHVNVLVATPLD
ncbi:MAG: hypothetical protein ABWY54_03115 [Glaciihabitans sp.]